MIERYGRIRLSAPILADPNASLDSKDLLTTGPVHTRGKYSLEEHLRWLAADQELRQDTPLLVLGLRNNLVNPRAIVLQEGRLAAPDGEDPAKSARPYYGLGVRNGRFVAETVLGEGRDLQQAPDLFWSGIPVLWDDYPSERLMDLFLTEASDHSHIFHLPRGNHPQATKESRAAWTHLQHAFRTQIYAPQIDACRAMRQALNTLPSPPHRADGYLHSALGLDSDGNLINVIAHGRLEHLGLLASRLGCTRAVCFENGGSIMPTFLPAPAPRDELQSPPSGDAEPSPSPSDTATAPTNSPAASEEWDTAISDAIPLLRAPHFRPKGRVLLVIELHDATFVA